MKLTKLVSKLFKLFIPSVIEEIAKETGFMKRHSKLLPETFAKALTVGLLDVKNITEEVIAQKCSSIQNGVLISKQAIKARLEVCVPFLKKLLEKALEITYSSLIQREVSPLLAYFKDVKLLDATTISLPDQVKDSYKGMGGNNADAALKLQVMYSIVNHAIIQLDVTSGVSHDATYLPKVAQAMTEKELFLADLGYFDIAFLSKLGEKNFFISRVKSSLLFYKAVSTKYAIYDKINLFDMLTKSPDEIDTWVYIGSTKENKLKVRLVGSKLPEHVTRLRIKKAITENKGQDISAEKRLLLHWNLMITNILSEMLETKVILELYRIRWQIEILFKVLKGSLSIDKMHNGKTQYVEALLYGRLVGTLLTMPLFSCVHTIMLQSKGRGVSIQRFYTLLLVEMYNFYNFSKLTIGLIIKSSQIIYNIGLLALDEKRERKTTYSQIESYLEESPHIGKI